MMMKDAIRIKGNKSGLIIQMNEEIDFDLIKKSLYEKLTASRKFFGHAKITLKLKGKELTEIEQNELVDMIHDSSDLEVLYIEEDEKIGKNQDFFEQISNYKKSMEDNLEDNNAFFHKGNLRSGQELNSQASIIIMGNVHHGASVSSKGNIIVIGRLNGSAYAGNEGDTNSFVVALNMNPTQIRIGNVIGRCDDITQKLKNKKIIFSNSPRIAYVEDNKIIIENLNKANYVK